MASARKAWLAALCLAAIWAVGLGVLGLFVVPMLFAHLPSPALAGGMAGRLFSAQTWISLVCSLGLVGLVRATPLPSAPRLTLLGLAGALLALVVEWGVSPHILARENLRFWHGLGSTLFLVQWLCALSAFCLLALGAPVLAQPIAPGD